jgi:AcrR family transcriptional regulator
MRARPHERVTLFPDRRRDRLIAAMAQVVSEDGYQAASVSRVVAAAGVSRNTFYEHFSNKEECFLASYDHAVERAVERARAASEGLASGLESFEAGLAALLSFAAEEPALAWLCIVEVLAAGPRALARRDETLGRVAAYLERLRADSGVERRPPLLTEIVVGGAYEVIYARILKGGTDQLHLLLPDIVYVWLAPIAGPVRASAARADAARRLGLSEGRLVSVAPEHGRMART